MVPPVSATGASALGKVLPWSQKRAHMSWLADQADRLFRFYERASLDPGGGYFTLDGDGRPQPTRTRDLVGTGRMLFCFSLGCLLGRPGAGAIADHGLSFLTNQLRDDVHGGYVWEWRDGVPSDERKVAYGHAFVLLGAAAAMAAGRPGASELLDDVTRVLDDRFWSDEHGLYCEEYTADWSVLEPYRGQNSNMHLVEALATVASVTGEASYRLKASRVAERLVNEVARAQSWRIPEHYDERWRIDRDYNRDDPENPYRPHGFLPGHACEWARLLVQLYRLNSDNPDWMPAAATHLVGRAFIDAWQRDGAPGMVYTLGDDGEPLNHDRYWWVHAEAIAALSVLGGLFGPEHYEGKYRQVWDFVQLQLIDSERGGWSHVIDASGRPRSGVWNGKPDLYHALQACLIPLLAPDGTNIVTAARLW